MLVEFAKRAKSVLRSGDLLARYGGEEFALLMTRTTVPDAILIAERIRQETAAKPVSFESNVIPITVSLGLSCLTGQTECQPVDLISRADEQLYVAKRTGRNKICYQSET